MTVRSAVPVRYLVQEASDIDAEAGVWLTAAEESAFRRLRSDKRRTEWRLGRWTAKRLIASYLHLTGGPQKLARVEILTAADGSPTAFLDGRPLGVTLSISHSGEAAACAVAPADAALGIDIERIRTLRAGTLRSRFTPGERALVADRDRERRAELATLIWSAKESALKALRSGLRQDTKAVEIVPHFDGPPEVWRTFAVEHARSKRTFTGWWRVADGFVFTLVADPPTPLPVPLDLD